MDHRGFQFALPRGERRLAMCNSVSNRHCFNSRSREGSDARLMVGVGMAVSFNSRSREGSDGAVWRDPRRYYVSIRAPARGATNPRARAENADDVSIRAPARGATWVISWRARLSAVSIRAPARGATNRLAASGLRLPVSIRAPARGATGCGQRAGHRYIGFNSRSREGSD